jgi:dipeptidyl aminopeptidase/acylaminoacyl peptidase
MSDASSLHRPLALSDLASLREVSDPQILPDGRQVAFVVETIDPTANDIRSQVWLSAPSESPRLRGLPKPRVIGAVPPSVGSDVFKIGGS